MAKSDKIPVFTAKTVRDDWKSVDYGGGRYLDSLAGILAIQGPCAAVTSHSGKFFVSYNSSASDITKNVLKEAFTLIQKKSVPELLPYYLVFNTEFRKLLENQVAHSGEAHKTVLSDLRSYLAILESSKNDLDRSCYSTQELDEIYKSHPKAVLSAEELSILQSRTDGKFAKMIDILRNKNHILEGIAAKYFELMEQLASTDDNDLKAVMIRPLQDVEKACSHLLKIYGDSEDIPFEVIDNARKIHAEVNIAKEFPRMGKAYIGISKLCCGACDSTLDEYGYIHRGTHGVCFPDDWVPPARQFENTIKTLHQSKIADIKPNDPVLMKLTRQLSHDDFESSLEFHSLKTKLFSLPQAEEESAGVASTVLVSVTGDASSAVLDSLD